MAAKKMDDAKWAEAKAMRDAGAKTEEVASKFGISQGLVSRKLGKRREKPEILGGERDNAQ